MGVVVAFDYNAWSQRYPEFSGVDQDLATMYFNEAAIYHANDGSGPIQNATTQLLLLGMLTAHIAKMSNAAAGGPTGLVGRITSVTEGSVSVSAENNFPPGSVQWYQQTAYGANYWNATRSYRTMRYRASPGRFNGGPWW